MKKKINIPLFNTSFTIVLYRDDAHLLELFPKYKFNNIENYDAFVTNVDEGLFVCFSAFYGQPKPGVIAHEAKHLVNAIFKDIGHKLDVDNDEVECYLLGHVVDKITDFLNIGPR